MARLGIAVALLGSAFTAGAAFACSCQAPPPPKIALSKATAVFTGRVTAIKEKDGQKLVTMTVQDLWKGNLKNQVTVKTAIQSATCGFPFQADAKYLVYAYEFKNELTTNLCSRTCLLERATEDLKELGPAPVKP